jgi:hypothetical protein
MDFSKNIKAFLGTFPIKDLSGHQMFLAIAAHCAKGDTSNQINTADVRDKWSKSLLRKKYNPAFYGRAQKAGWVDPVQHGIFIVNDDGIQHLDDLTGPNSKNIASLTGSGLFIFDKKSTHTFDKFLRNILANAKSRVYIADSWVDDTIFDNVLDSIPKTISINLIYGQKRGSFDSRVNRFKNEYSKFIVKKYGDLHDRFLIVDDASYVIGPSLKNAAENSPALVVALSKKDSTLLVKFFQILWVRAK